MRLTVRFSLSILVLFICTFLFRMANIGTSYYSSIASLYYETHLTDLTENTIQANLVPDLASVFDKIEPYFYTDKEQEIINQYFPTCPNISIDYAVMEKSKEVYVYPANFGWSDLGTWGSLYTHLQQDENNNATVGQNINLVDCKNCVVHTPSERKVVIQGLDNYIVAESDNTLLICKKEDEQQIKDWQK